MRRIHGRALLLGLLLLLAAAAPAQAGTVQQILDDDGNVELQFNDPSAIGPAAAEDNNLVVEQIDSDTIRFTDNNGNDIIGCGNTSDESADCNFTVLDEIVVNLGGADDEASFTGSFSGIAPIVNAGAGNDEISGSGVADSLNGDAGNDTLRGLGGDDTYNGGAGEDDLGDQTASTDGFDTVAYGGSAPVTAIIGAERASGTTCPGPDCRDTIRISVERLVGGSGNDNLTGSNAANTLEGGNGNDTLNGLGGNDIYIGGTGTSHGSDTVSYATRSQNFTIALAVTGVAQTVQGSEQETYTSIENATGGNGDDTITGSTGGNTINGGPGNDVLKGSPNATPGGSDTLVGGTGFDHANYGDRATDLEITTHDNQANDGEQDDPSTPAPGVPDPTGDFDEGEYDNVRDDVERITTGSGTDEVTGSAVDNEFILGGGTEDRVTYADKSAGAPVTVNLASGGGSFGEFDTYTGVENLTGGAGNDRLIGTIGSNDINGAGGDDVLDGRAGPDNLEGSGGNDTVDYSAPGRTPGITANLGGGADDGNVDDQTAGVGPFDNVTNTENVIGTNGDDVINGTGSNNQFQGLGGDDTIEALGGHDILLGGTGADNLSGSGGDDIIDPGSESGGPDNTGVGNGDTVDGGGGGQDVVSYAERTEGVTVILNGTTANGGAGEQDGIQGIEAIVGGSGNDLLTGNNDDNVISGGGGDDALNGLGGKDSIDGGTGSDTSDGGDADDTFTIRDGVLDGLTTCGGGNDTVTADFNDPTANDCETVSRSADPNNPNPPNNPTPPGNTNPTPPGNTNPTPPPPLNDPRAVLRGPRQLPRRLSATVGPRRDRRAPYRFLVSGTLSLPTAFAPFRREVCAEGGRVSVQTKLGSRTVSTRRVRIQSDCSYDVTVTFRNKRRLLGRRRSATLKFTARFLGNRYLRPMAGRSINARVG